MKIETWNDIPNYEGLYQVSNLGNVFSLISNKILKPAINSAGYKTLLLSKNKKQKSVSVHFLVASAFLNHKSSGHNFVVDHIDGDKTNNKVSNLRIITQRNNLSNNSFRKDIYKLSSKYTGVHFDKNAGKYRAEIIINKKKIYLGLFENEIDAANAYKLELFTL